MHSRKISKDLLKMDSINGPSCNDLNGSDCEGWLWFKQKNRYLQRWCILRSKLLSLMEKKESQDCQATIKLFNSEVTQIHKSKSHNFYFKICYDSKIFIFGTESKSDYLKWLNKLHLSAAGIEINEKDGPVGGFTSGYILEPINLPKVIEDTNHKANHIEDIDPLSDSVFINSPDKGDKRLQVFYDRSHSESSSLINSEIHPVVPPRKYSYTVNKKNINKYNNSSKQSNASSSNNEHQDFRDRRSMSENANSDYEIFSEIVRAPDSKESTDHKITETNNILKRPNNSQPQSSPSSSNKSVYSQNQKNNKSTEQISINISINTPAENSDFQINSIKKIAELERLIRDKNVMLAKLDKVLMSSHLTNSIHEFWDEHGQDILNINAIHLSS